jgi:predicted Fe-Mo cluster-binding NifX family protein
MTGASGMVREVVEKYKRGELKETSAPKVHGHFGMGRGRGRNGQ